MSALRSAIYVGHVVHKRLRPRQHAFRYRVFSLCLDVDEIDMVVESSRILRRNRWGLMSFYDHDHGSRDGERVNDYVRRLLSTCDLADQVRRIELLCYPRLLGYVFNPLSVYFCYDAGNQPVVVIYEVTNTFGERTSYVIPVVERPAGKIWQSSTKRMYVSPFTQADCAYGFHVSLPGEDVAVGVNVRDALGPVLKTHFSAERRPMTDANLRAVMRQHPLMTLKVIAAIHFEALRLWLKRVPVVRHESAPRHTIVPVPSTTEPTAHAR